MGSDKEDYTLGISILEQALANLTAVVSATALDIRPLQPTDLPHEGLPYNFIPLHWFNAAAIGDGQSGTGGWNVSDWGADKDFYVVSICFKIGLYTPLAQNQYVKFYHGFRLELLEIRSSAPHPLIAWGDVNPRIYPPIRDGSNWYISGTILTNRNKVDIGNSLQIKIYNESGAQVETAAVDIFVLGMAT